MVSKNQIKYINSLQIKKYRQQHQSFLVEGDKSVMEVLASDYQVEVVYTTAGFLEKNQPELASYGVPLETVTPAELEKLGTFQTNDTCLAVAKTKENTVLSAGPGEYALLLDDVRDPGNLGTILRIADWYGFTKVICSESTTDLYNPKVIAASKGSFTRVRTYYTDLPEFLRQQSPELAVVGALLRGESLYDFQFPDRGGYLVMGNESNGIGPEVEALVTRRVTIPRFGGAESLNVGIATAILCDNLRRQLHISGNGGLLG
jgi:RNA methyltransferase, TrmH family